jgi:hypothetical protein
MFDYDNMATPGIPSGRLDRVLLARRQLLTMGCTNDSVHADGPAPCTSRM